MFCFRGNVKLPMSLPHWKAVCTSCLNSPSMRFGRSFYTGHALLMRELLNFIVSCSSSCSLNFSVSLIINLLLSLPLSVHLIQYFCLAFSFVLYCSHSSMWALRSSVFIYMWILMSSVGWISRVCELSIIPKSVSYWIIQDFLHNSGCQNICQSSGLYHDVAVYLHMLTYMFVFCISYFINSL